MNTNSHILAGAAFGSGLAGLVFDVQAAGETVAIVWCVFTITLLACAVGLYKPNFKDPK